MEYVYRSRGGEDGDQDAESEGTTELVRDIDEPTGSSRVSRPNTGDAGGETR